MDTVRIVVNGWFWDRMTAGSGQYLVALAAALSRLGTDHEFVLALPGSDLPARALPIGWAASQVALPARRSENLAKVWFEQIAFPWLCRRLEADVAFVPYWGSPWWRPCPVVVTVHDLIPLLLPLYQGGLLQRVYTGLVSATAKRADAIVTDSAASCRDIISHLGIPAHRVHAVHLAADSVDARQRSIQDSSLRARLRLPDGAFLLYLGGFDARKNVGRMLQGYARLVQRCAAEQIAAPALVIAGKLPSTNSAFAPDPRPIVAALGLSERVHFVGWVDEADKAALYALASGVLFISEYEGFGLPVLEAMAEDRTGTAE